jgi:hypothetical protein
MPAENHHQQTAIDLLKTVLDHWGDTNGFAFYTVVGPSPISADAGIKISVTSAATYFGRGANKVECFFDSAERLLDTNFASVPGMVAQMRMEMDEKLDSARR